MTIVKSSQYLAHYPFQVLPPLLVECMRRNGSSVEHVETALKLFECYCHLSNAKIKFPYISGQEFRSIVVGFFGALQSTSFYAVKASTRRAIILRLTKILINIQKESATFESIQWDAIGYEESVAAWEAISKALNPIKVRYWNGWEVLTQKNESLYIPLANIWNSHGETFAEEIYLYWRRSCEKKRRPASTTLNKFLDYLNKNVKQWPPDTFCDPIRIKQFFISFMKEYFIEAYNNKCDINSQLRAWNSFVVTCEEAFIQSGAWAEPFGDGLPKPKKRNPPGTQTRIKRNHDGVEVHCKLITHVPLHVTDDQAIEILFKEINRDIQTIKSWALTTANDLYSRVQRRLQLAKEGVPTSLTGGLRSAEEIGFNNICATFEAEGFKSGKRTLYKSYGHFTKLTELAYDLGLPTTNSLFCYQCLLVCEHPEITPGFLDGLLLYDEHGHQTGFVQTDRNGQLKGSKPRKGTKHSEQRIELNEKSTQWIKQIIEITAPLRTQLKTKADSNWRYLFLTCGKGFTPPSRCGRTRWTKHKLNKNSVFRQKLEAQFHPFTSLRGEGFVDFLSRVTLSSLRASCGVSIYIKTKSVVEMAKALGHLRYDRHLLRHYLPESILAFFQTRWIRIFQRNLICEAMKESPLLLKAANFQSMDELHNFLKNHALREIPSHIKEPTYLNQNNDHCENETKVFISIDIGIMTTLISLERAVTGSIEQNRVSARARYWSDLSKAVEFEISTGNDKLLKDHLATAIKNCEPAIMKKIIYEDAV